MGIAELSGSNSVVKGVKGNAESSYRTGLVNLTPANIGALALAGGKMTGTLSFNDNNALPQRTSGTVYPLTINAFADGGIVGWSDASTFRSLISAQAAGTYIKSESKNGYYGMLRPDGNSSDYIRTTTSGIIPYQSGGSGYIGTSSWPFSYGYFKSGLYLNGKAVSVDGHTHSYMPKTTVLYNNATGSTGTITLSASAANYNHMRIYFRGLPGNTGAYNKHASIDVYSPNGRYVSLVAGGPGYPSSTAVDFQTRVALISGTSINNTRSTSGNLQPSPGAGVYNEVYIVRVEAWNE